MNYKIPSIQQKQITYTTRHTDSSDAEKQEVLAYIATEKKHVQRELLGLKRKVAALEPEPEPLQKHTRFNSPSILIYYTETECDINNK